MNLPNVLIAGGTCYIGTACHKMAMDMQLNPIVLTRSISSQNKLREQNIATIHGNLFHDGEWNELAKTVEYAVFLASPPTWGAKVTKKVAETYQKDHQIMTRKFLEAFVGSKVKKIVYVAGTSYFGDAGDTQPQNKSIHPNPKGWGPYIAPSIKIVMDYIQKGLPITIVFPGQVYGPGSWLEQLCLQPIYSGKKLTRLKGYSPIYSPIHVEDCGRAIIHLLTTGQIGEKYILVDDMPVHSREFSAFIAEQLSTPLQIREVPKWLCNLVIGPVLTEYATIHTNFSNKKLKATGFTFNYPTYEKGLPNVIQTWLAQQNANFVH
ncbi:NAD(P)-dependent oxidoreductase [Bacillus sp. FDAARGOS_235]|uniref:NAD-dependent epimerase/dehydratase family protein n=1 Tax=Bacillus sp. FDAARGOS_235 TaxID=1839798 RepID=UPI0011A441E9|nr:NAD(P)-dependent oxidoreductase [Bacillus sp. FDAARGOS_235]